MKAKEAKQRDDAREDVRLQKADFEKYVNATIRRQAASLYSKDNPTVNECIKFRYFIVTEVTLCNSNRPGIPGIHKHQQHHRKTN